jgi:putative membrane protein
VAELGALTPVAVVAALYALGVAHARSRSAEGAVSIGPARVGAGAAGIAALAVALGPPIEGWASTNLTAHMMQHVLLLTIAPPLLIVGMVPAVLLNGVSTDRLTPALRRVPVFVWTAIAVGMQTLALGVWHLPAIYDAAVAHVALHAAEHLSFLVTGLAFWWIVAGAGRRGSASGTAAAVITVFVASLPGTLLGALMTLSTSPWYPRYATGSLSAALQDQQLAGVVMWAVGGMAYVVAGAALFVAWLRDIERTSPSRAGLEPVR